MEKETIKNYAIVGLLLSTLASMGLQPTHYCDSREIKAYCYRLSDSLKTCYTISATEGGKRCTEGWKTIEEALTEKELIESVKIYGNEREWICPTKDGEIWSYSKCFSEGREAYLGELI